MACFSPSGGARDGSRPGPDETRDASAAGPAAGTETVAVALGYDPEAGRAPTVLAKGRGGIAEQIVALAFANDIKVREDADLVQILAAIDLDSEIPLEALAAVAEILSYVYRANGRLALDAPPGPGEEGVDEDGAAVFRRSLRVALGEDDAVDEDESPGAEGHHREGA